MPGEKKRSRGVSKCKKKLLNPDEFTVAFDAIGRAVGKTGGEFMSWIGVEFRKRIPYDKLVRDVDPKKYEDVWQFAKETWKIPNDDAKKLTLSHGKSMMRTFRWLLRKDYIYNDESLDDDEYKKELEAKSKKLFEKYDYLDKGAWNSFVSATNNEDWKEKRQKGKESAKHNTVPAHLGRRGYAALEPEIETRWDQLVSSYPFLNFIQDERSKKLTVSKAHFNPITNLYELGEELKSKEKLSAAILKQKKKKRKVEAIELSANESPDTCGLNRASCSSSTEISSITKCELLYHDDQGALKIIAMGRVHPNPGRIIHGCPMIDGFVKVQVDRVIEGCGSTRLLPESCTDEMEYLEDAKGSFIQWPLKFIKTLNNDSSQFVEPSHHSMTTPYRPQFEATSTHPDQTFLDERDKYQIYSYALQDDDAFTELLAANQPTELVRYCQSTKPVASSKPLTEKTEVLKEKTKMPTATSKCLIEESEVSKEKTKMHVASSKPLMEDERTKIAKLLEKARSRPQSIYELAQHVALQSEKALSIACITPLGMHEDHFEETIEFEEVIQICVNGLVEVCFMHWFTMHLYETARRAGLNDTAYFHPRYIEGDLVSDDGDFVIDHIKNVISFHKDKQWFMAPYLVRRHWVLILLQLQPISKTWKGYIFDSLKGAKDPTNYEITALFEKATNQKITWDMVHCRQQPNGWECGYCVMMAMYDFVICEKEYMRESKTKMVRANEINKFVELTLKAFTTIFADREDE